MNASRPIVFKLESSSADSKARSSVSCTPGVVDVDDSTDPVHDQVCSLLARDPLARVRIEAVPGAGKTALIVRACTAAYNARDDRALTTSTVADDANSTKTLRTQEEGSSNADDRPDEDNATATATATAARCLPSLVLAYNRQLATDISSRLPPDGTLCLTFHSLCSRCLAPARDDVQLLDAVERAERGDITPTNVPAVSRVFVDEAQDVREIYVRLVRVLGLHNSSIVVAGDRNQLVYDFDPDAPATLRTLVEPWSVFDSNPDHKATEGGGGAHTTEGAIGVEQAWSSFVLTKSYRLTPPIAALVNAVFDTSIVASGGRSYARACDAPHAPPVDVRVPKNMWSDLYDVLRDVLEGDDDVLLLVDYKHGNTALRRLLNTVSRRGSMRVVVHGVDVVDNDDASSALGSSSAMTNAPTKPTLTCGTFWSAKGLQCRTCVVVLPEQAARNPTYVALTRASHQLILVLDSRRPHPNVCSALRTMSANAHMRFDVKEREHVRYADEFARHVVRTGSGLHADGVDGLCKRSVALATSTDDDGRHYRSLDRWTPRSNCAATAMMIVTKSESAEPNVDEGDGACRSSCIRRCSGDVVVQMCLVNAEFDAKRRVRGVEDIAHPTRLDRARHAGAIRAGCASRFVSPFATDDELLADDLRTACLRAYDRMLARSSVRAAATVSDGEDHVAKCAKKVCTAGSDSKHLADVAIVALSIMSFDSWDHTMRTLLPSVRAWSPSVSAHLDFVASVLPRTSNFDVRLYAESCHVRVHATTPEKCFHVVWEESSSDVAAAGLRAALHPRHVCTLVDVSARTCTDVSVAAHDVATFMQS